MSNYAQQCGDRHEVDGRYDEPQGRRKWQPPITNPPANAKTAQALAAQQAWELQTVRRKELTQRTAAQDASLQKARATKAAIRAGKSARRPKCPTCGANR